MPKKKILVIDDEEDFVQLIKLNLEKTGDYEVMTETKGVEAVNRALEFKPDLIFLDIMMPDLDGTIVMDDIKANKELEDIPVVFLTAIATKTDQFSSKGGTIGGQQILAKPVTTKELVECIKVNVPF